MVIVSKLLNYAHLGQQNTNVIKNVNVRNQFKKLCTIELILRLKGHAPHYYHLRLCSFSIKKGLKLTCVATRLCVVLHDLTGALYV